MSAAYDALCRRLARVSEEGVLAEGEAQGLVEAIDDLIETIRLDPARSRTAMVLRAKILLDLLPQDYDDDMTGMARRLASDVLDRL